ncbi:uncharacterized protein JN550_006796 [Neoarthrinium moseri]|uniref:uncharacterized protein n=1 Tax=Neoarthrinium moseri TaxID=1658444 RepID=UPI001FDC2904|nr:uncharacterized protein JN550_006796 [Neoarthrinium moseri]KAI1867989.1 hypothetical protein JN550_006796 [Neoarthrinium moseri]
MIRRRVLEAVSFFASAPPPVLRQYSALRLSSLYRFFSMASSASRFQLWHPSRGISFSTGASTSSSNVYGPRRLSHSAPALVDHGTAAPNTPNKAGKLSNDASNESPEQKDPLYPELPAAADTSLRNGDQGEAATTPNAGSDKKAEKRISNDPPYPALEYAVSEDLFRAAKEAEPGTPESFWSYALYRGPNEDGVAQKPKVHYCRSKHTTERVCQQYFMNEKVLGFDLEWFADAPRSAGPRKNVSLIQLASPSRIALFHVALFSKDDDFAAPSFKKIMEDPEITKVGVWIKGDATRLRTHLGIDSKGLMELSHLYKLVTYSRTGQFSSINKRLMPLSQQVEEYLHLPMFKGQDVRSSDWTKPLHMNQVIYSASDAYAGVHLYATLEHHRKQLEPCPPRPHHAELNLPIRLADGLDLETDSEAEASEPRPEEEEGTTSILSPAARRRQLKAYLRSAKESIASVAKTISQAEKILDLAVPKDPRVEAADAWVAAFKLENQPADVDTKKTGTHASSYELRAYHLWHANKDMSIQQVAQLLRNPPLKTTTVANYVWRAVQRERLPVQRLRYEREVVQLLPKSNQGYARRAI